MTEIAQRKFCFKGLFSNMSLLGTRNRVRWKLACGLLVRRLGYGRRPTQICLTRTWAHAHAADLHIVRNRSERSVGIAINRSLRSRGPTAKTAKRKRGTSGVQMAELARTKRKQRISAARALLFSQAAQTHCNWILKVVKRKVKQQKRATHPRGARARAAQTLNVK